MICKRFLNTFCIGLLSVLTACIVMGSATAQKQAILNVLTQKPGAVASPNMWGIFFEDINFSADGGLYAELVKNRSFEFGTPKMGWREWGSGNLLVNNRSQANPANPHYAAITVQDTFTIANEGFRGMGIRSGEQYDFSAWVQPVVQEAPLAARLRLVSAKGEVIGEKTLSVPTGGNWQKIKTSFNATQTDARAHLQLTFMGKGTVNMDIISLFPKDTWKGRPGGMRKDLVQKLDSLKPGFIRFPGGCIVEGRTLETRYQWKKTVGPVDEREGLVNRWNTEFDNKSAVDYYQTFGLGFFEYFQLCEDIGAKPLPILNCGMACEFNTGEVVAMNELDPFVQDAVDLIEFANGDVTTTWGGLRSRMGHPAPFNLDRIGIGNEQWDKQYFERYKAFEKVLKQRYPQIMLVGAAGPGPNGWEFDMAWKELPQTAVSFIDEHYYQSPQWFLNNATRYDHYDRKGPKVFAGEYASHDREGKEPESRNTWLSALTEAAFMTGLERNADVVQMAAYAPLFAHVDAWQWRPDLIWFDNLQTVGTPNYYVQQLFSTNRGNVSVPLQLNGAIVAGGTDSLYGSAMIDSAKKELVIKLVNVSGKVVNYTVQADDKKIGGKGTLQVLTAAQKEAFNSFSQPYAIVPTRQPLKAAAGKIQVTLAPLSVNVVRVKMK